MASHVLCMSQHDYIATGQQEDLYTTKLDKGKSRISEAEAARLAAEIMGDARSGTANAHIAEERGMEVDDSGVSLMQYSEEMLCAFVTSLTS